MDNIALAQLTALQQNAGLYNTSAAGSTATGGDGFAQLLALILGQTQTGTNGLFSTAQSEDILAGLSDNGKSLTPEQQEQAMQLLMASLLANAQSTAVQPTADLTAAYTTATDTVSQQQLTNIQSLYSLLESAVDTNGNGVIEAEEYQTLLKAVGLQTQSAESTVQGTVQNNASGEDLLLNSRFLNAASEAQKLMDGEEVSTAQQEQAASLTETGETAPVDNTPQSEKLIDGEALRNDLTEEVAKRAQSPSLGNEFTVKLKPEGLGEITVRLTKSDGHISLNIVTGTDYAAKLIASEAGNLAAALKPLDAGIAGIVTAAQQTESYAFAGGGFAQQQNNGFANGSRDNGSANRGAYTDNTVNAAESAAQGSIASSALDTYV